MIENIVTCDRCKKKCEGTTYYSLRIDAYDIKPSNDGRVAFETLANNAHELTRGIFGAQRQFCKNCISKFEKFMGTDEGE